MLINIYQRGETKTMKKSSAWFMLTPGLVILFLFLAIPLLRVLFPSIFSGAYPFDAYVGFFQDEYYRKIFIRTVKIAVITTFVCMVGHPLILSAGAARNGEGSSLQLPFSQ